MDDEALMIQEDMFADLRRGTGAVIITSSSGDEYSIESETLGVNYDQPSKSAKARLGLPSWRFIQMQKLCKATFAANRTRIPWR